MSAVDVLLGGGQQVDPVPPRQGLDLLHEAYGAEQLAAVCTDRSAPIDSALTAFGQQGLRLAPARVRRGQRSAERRPGRGGCRPVLGRPRVVEPGPLGGAQQVEGGGHRAGPPCPGTDRMSASVASSSLAGTGAASP